MAKIIFVFMLAFLSGTLLSHSAYAASVWGGFTGTTNWRVGVSESGCGVDGQKTEEVYIKIDNGLNAQTTIHGREVNGQLSDNRLVIGKFSFEDSGGTTNLLGATIAFGVECQTFQSRYYWDWYEGAATGSPTCSGSTQLSAVRTDGGKGCGETKPEASVQIPETTALSKIPDVGSPKEVSAVEAELKYVPVYKDVEKFFEEGGELSAEDLERIKNQLMAFQAEVDGKEGDNLDINLPKGSPLEKMSAPLEQSVRNAKTTVSFIDAKGLNKAVRDLGKPSELKDFPPVSNPPSPDKYTDPKYFRLDTYDKNGVEISPYGEGVFNINVPKSEADRGTVRLLRHYKGETRAWQAFEARLDSCYAQTCRYVVDPPMYGYFAIVVEKESNEPSPLEKGSNGTSPLVWMLFAAAAVAAIAYFLAINKPAGK